MHALILGVTWGVLGLNAGWKPLPGGGVEYIIQIAPHELEIFKQEKIIESEVPPQVKDIRSYRIQIGNELLPKQDPLPPKTPSTPLTPARPASPAEPAKAPPAKRTPAFNPFSSLTSFAERYPSSQGSPASPGSSAESAKRDGARLFGSAKAPDDKTPGGKKPDDKKPDDKSAKSQPPASKEPAKPWVPFTVAVVALFGSLGLNVYLGWITSETRKRYRSLLRRRTKSDHHRKGETHEPDHADE
jgi:hypothetical protein